jgi:autotransporter-associated beta strand protein
MPGPSPSIVRWRATETFNNDFLGSPSSGATAYSFVNNSATSGAKLNIVGNITGQMTASTETFTFDGTNGGTVSGIIANGTGGGTVSFTKAGAGTWTLSGANTYTGVTTISAGTLALSGGDNRLSTAGAVTFSGNSTFNLASTSQTLSVSSVNNGITGTVTGVGGTLTLTGAANTIGNTVAGTSTLDMSGLSNFAYNNATGTFGVQALTATGAAGVIKLAGNNTITAATFKVNASAGTTAASNLQLGASNIIDANTIQVGLNASANLNFRSGLTAPTVTIRDASGGSTASITVGSSGSQGTISTMDLSGSTMDIMANNLTLGLANRGQSGSPSNPAVSGTAILGAGNAAFTTVVLGQMTLSTSGYNSTGVMTTNGGAVSIQTLTIADKVSTAGNSITGTFNLNGGTTLSAQTIQAGTQATGGTQTRTINWNDGTIKNYDAATDLSVNAGSGSSALTIKLAATGTHTFDIDSGRTATVAPVLANATTDGTLTKAGAGTLVLSGASTYTGATTVKAGTVIVSGSLSGTSAVTVGDSTSLSTAAILGGSGTVGNVTASGSGDQATSGAQIDPGNSSNVAGILKTGSLSVTSGAHLSMQIGGATAGGDVSTGYDQVVTAATVSLTGGDLKLTLQGAPTFSGSDVLYLIVNNSGSAVTGAFSTVFLNGSLVSDTSNILLNGQQFSLVYSANFAGTGSDNVANDLALVAVPEPGTWGTMLGGLAALLTFQRRRRRF